MNGTRLIEPRLHRTDGKGKNRTRLIEPRLHRTDGKG
jgi:hypothetical protein